MIDAARRSDPEDMSTQVEILVSRLWQQHFQEYCPADAWSPPVNLYRLDRRIEVCVDLAGMNPKTIDVQVEPGRLTIRGMRPAPQPTAIRGERLFIESMEINHGSFCRTVSLPGDVDIARVESQYKRGLLWIRLPIREPG